MKEFLNKYLFVLLVPTYPILLLIDTNLGQIFLSNTIRSLIIVFSISLIVAYLINKYGNEIFNLSFLYVFLSIIFFSYERVRNLFINNSFDGLGRHRYLMPIFALMIIILIILLKKYPITSASSINLFSLVLVTMPIFNILLFGINSFFVDSQPTNDLGITIDMPDSQKPDIYFIILDSYSRDDILDKVYQFDNQPFLNLLENLGFFIGKCSQSNYPHTQFSLSSTLNLDYLHKLEVEIEREGQSIPALWPFIQESLVRLLFTNADYSYVAVKTMFPWANIENADIYYSADDPIDSLLVGNGAINEFENLLMKNSFAKYVQKFIYSLFVHENEIESDNFSFHRNQLLNSLEKLETIPSISGPKFNHIHLIIPHAPFIFGSNGEDVIPPEIPTRESNIEGYIDQVKFINNRLIPIITSIIENSEVPPIIVLQGDHGGKDTFGEDRHAILNAIYLPYGDPNALYPEISSVNTFRLILNEAFGNNLEILPDLAFGDYENENDVITPVNNNREGCANTIE